VLTTRARARRGVHRGPFNREVSAVGEAHG
jgi:hypothetical protein